VIENRNQRLRRSWPVAAMAAVSFAIGAIVATHQGSSPSSSLAQEFVRAWTHRDYRTMYSDIDPASQRNTSPSRFASDYQAALRTATARQLLLAGRPHRTADGAFDVPVRVRTQLFGTLSLSFHVEVADREGVGSRVLWSRSLTFPGLRAGERLSRHTTLPRRATLLARDGSVLAESPPGASAPASATGETTRSSPLGESARALLGTVGPIPSSRRASLEDQGVPPTASVGLTGLERALDSRLRGTAGGALLAGRRLLAYASPSAAPALRTTISPTVQEATVSALAGRLGGIVAMEPQNGQILAVAGLGLDGLQPPGSTFKMITLTGVLQAHVASPRTVFPYATHAVLDGVTLNNANGEECGGSLAVAFAVSCNSVFTPLGVRLGATRLVATAEHFGFNHDPAVPGAATSTLPPASEIHGELAVGSTAIGQGRVLATPLQMAIVAATIADGGLRPQPSFLHGGSSGGGTRTTSVPVAHTVRRLMTAVVRVGTGTKAAIPGVTVAGKTGTAELKTRCSNTTPPEATREAGRESCAGTETEASNTDAWFAAFAPALSPRVAVCVMLVKDGAGGDTAAPVAREVLEAGLRATR
jgi:peptidoglycan glycosyltransferase